MGYVSKEITEGVCFSGETAIATGGKAEPAIATGGKAGESIVTGSGDIGHVGGREESVANGNGDTPPAGAASPSGEIGHVGLAHSAGETAMLHVKLQRLAGLQLFRLPGFNVLLSIV